MNKTAIKNFAIWARVQLLEAAKLRAFEYEVTEGGQNLPNRNTVGERLLSNSEVEQRNQLISEISRKGFTQVMEEAAYTWFNRFIALRYMEVNGFLPSKVRVFTDESGSFKPDILKEAMSVEMDGLDRNKVLELLDKQDNEALYKYLLITQCNALNQGLPYMFEKISNWTEILFPANLLRADSIIGRMVNDIPEEDWLDAVQVIGWLYQYYNSELKDETFALLKKNVKISKERIPAATQLFTPDWIVRYMVENSLGRLWLEGHPNDEMKTAWKYYLDEAKQDDAVEAQLVKIREEAKSLRPQDIKIIDPCMGSGHILVYAFDVLMQIYTASGWSERDAAKSIVENNLYGLDIDDRAGQLAYFAVMMKARKYSRRILNGEVRPNVMSIQDSSFMDDGFIAYIAGNDVGLKADLTRLQTIFHDAKEYGSILTAPQLDYAALYERIDIVRRSFSENLFEEGYQKMATELLLPLVKQAEILAQKYDVVVTNPPYMGGSGMSAKLGEFVKKNYPDSKSDLFAVFIERCAVMLKQRGYQAMITQHAWMFLSSYERLREKLLMRDTVNMAHLGARAFEEIGGEVVQTTSFVFRNTHANGFKGTYCRLIDPTTQNGKEEMFLAGENRYYSAQSNFSKIPGSPIAYWVSAKLFEFFKNNVTLEAKTECAAGVSSGNNEKYLKLWFEVDFDDINSGCVSDEIFKQEQYKYAYCNKGGLYRKWFGNNEYVALWIRSKEFHRNGSTYKNLLFKAGITWSALASGKFNARYYPVGYVFDHAAPSMFAQNGENVYYLLGLVNSSAINYILNIINPTINMGADTLRKIPFDEKKQNANQVVTVTKFNIELAKDDWDSFETSWDFKKHPLV